MKVCDKIKKQEKSAKERDESYQIRKKNPCPVFVTVGRFFKKSLFLSLNWLSDTFKSVPVFVKHRSSFIAKASDLTHISFFFPLCSLHCLYHVCQSYLSNIKNSTWKDKRDRNRHLALVSLNFLCCKIGWWKRGEMPSLIAEIQSDWAQMFVCSWSIDESQLSHSPVLCLSYGLLISWA